MKKRFFFDATVEGQCLVYVDAHSLEDAEDKLLHGDGFDGTEGAEWDAIPDMMDRDRASFSHWEDVPKETNN